MFTKLYTSLYLQWNTAVSVPWYDYQGTSLLAWKEGGLEETFFQVKFAFCADKSRIFGFFKLNDPAGFFLLSSAL